MATGGLKTWQYGTLVVSCIGSMLAGASVVHRIFPPDLVRDADGIKTENMSDSGGSCAVPMLRVINRIVRLKMIEVAAFRGESIK